MTKLKILVTAIKISVTNLMSNKSIVLVYYIYQLFRISVKTQSVTFAIKCLNSFLLKKFYNVKFVVAYINRHTCFRIYVKFPFSFFIKNNYSF